MKRLLLLPVVLLLLQWAPNAFAASGSIYINDAAKDRGVFYLEGVGFDNVGGVEVEIQYDTTTLANPRISQGPLLASTMFIPNPTFKANVVKIAAMSLSPITGTKNLAVITFDLKGDKAGFVTIVRNKLAEASTGVKVPEQPAVVGSVPGFTGNQLPPASTDTGTPPAGIAPSTTLSGIAMGTITLPTDQLATTDRKPDAQPLVTELRKDLAVPAAGSEAAAKDKTTKEDARDKAAEQRFETYNGVLELFKLYQGERNEQALISLFAEVKIPGLTQTPAIALADGKTPMKIVLELKPSGDESPKFIAQGASIKQLSAGDDGATWTIELLPRKDALAARLTVIDGNRMFDYPLTVAPLIDPLLLKGKKLSDADFKLYLAKPSKYDWNGDGKFDALDDYIYTANYISALNIKPVKRVSEGAPEKGATEAVPVKGSKEEKAVPGTGSKPVKTDAAEPKEKAAPEQKAVPTEGEPQKEGKGKVKGGKGLPKPVE